MSYIFFLLIPNHHPERCLPNLLQFCAEHDHLGSPRGKDYSHVLLPCRQQPDHHAGFHQQGRTLQSLAAGWTSPHEGLVLRLCSWKSILPEVSLNCYKCGNIHSFSFNLLRFSVVFGADLQTLCSVKDHTLFQYHNCKCMYCLLTDEGASWSCDFVGAYHGLVPESCCFSADGSLLAVSFQEVVTVWSPLSWELLTTLSQPPRAIRSEHIHAH